MYLVHNERVKLTASWLNSSAVVLSATGAFAAFANLTLGLQAARLDVPYVIGFSLGCLAMGFGLHLAAGWYLGRLRE